MGEVVIIRRNDQEPVYSVHVYFMKYLSETVVKYFERMICNLATA